MISLRFLRRSPGLENETDIQFRDSKRGRGEEGHPNGIKLGLKQALEMHKLKVVQECEW